MATFVPDEFLTLPEVAQLLKVADKTVSTMAQQMEIPAFKVRGSGASSVRISQARIQLNADFPLSGLKTAVRLAIESAAPLRPQDVNDLCASFQAAVVDVVVDRMRMGSSCFVSA
jgi:excisionase family DNA binding protein